MLQRGAITPLYVPENGYGCLERLPTAPKQVPLEQRGDLAATTPPAGPTQGLPEGHSCWDELGFPTSLALRQSQLGSRQMLLQPVAYPAKTTPGQFCKDANDKDFMVAKDISA